MVSPALCLAFFSFCSTLCPLLVSSLLLSHRYLSLDSGSCWGCRPFMTGNFHSSSTPMPTLKSVYLYSLFKAQLLVPVTRANNMSAIFGTPPALVAPSTHASYPISYPWSCMFTFLPNISQRHFFFFSAVPPTARIPNSHLPSLSCVLFQNLPNWSSQFLCVSVLVLFKPHCQIRTP